MCVWLKQILSHPDNLPAYYHCKPAVSHPIAQTVELLRLRQYYYELKWLSLLPLWFLAHKHALDTLSTEMPAEHVTHVNKTVEYH